MKTLSFDNNLEAKGEVLRSAPIEMDEPNSPVVIPPEQGSGAATPPGAKSHVRMEPPVPGTKQQALQHDVITASSVLSPNESTRDMRSSSTGHLVLPTSPSKERGSVSSSPEHAHMAKSESQQALRRRKSSYDHNVSDFRTPSEWELAFSVRFALWVIIVLGIFGVSAYITNQGIIACQMF